MIEAPTLLLHVTPPFRERERSRDAWLTSLFRSYLVVWIFSLERTRSAVGLSLSCRREYMIVTTAPLELAEPFFAFSFLLPKESPAPAWFPLSERSVSVYWWGLEDCLVTSL